MCLCVGHAMICLGPVHVGMLASQGNTINGLSGWRVMQATGKRLVVVSRVSVCIWAIIMGIAMSIAQAATINVNWLITIIGTPNCVLSPLICRFQAQHTDGCVMA